MSEREELEGAIAALEAQRAALGDAVVDASQKALRAQLAALDAAGSPDQQSKQVTILFMDVVGSTDIVRELDPEDNLAITDTALRRLSDPVTRHSGRVTRYMGDGFMALFGHPTASEHDPDNAVLAGLAQAALMAGDESTALLYVEEILGYFDGGGTAEGSIEEPLRVYRACYQVLHAVGDPRANQLLSTAYQLLQERAAKLDDESTRRSFLENVLTNRQIVEAARLHNL